MLRPFVALIAVLASALVTLPAQAQWKWKDKSGHTQYSDLPPPLGTAEQEILSRPNSQRPRLSAAPTAAMASSAGGVAAAGSGAASGALVAKTVDAELEAKRKKVEADQAAKVKADEARIASAKAENCVRARSQVKTFDSGIRVVRTNEKGEREFLDDRQRADELKRAKDIVSADCK